MGRHGTPEALWGNIPERRHRRCRGPRTEQAGLRHISAFTAYGGLVGDTHKWSSAALCGQWEDRGHRYPLEEQGKWQGPFFTFFLCPGTLFPSLGTEGPNIQTDRGGKKVKMKVSAAKSCLTLCDLMDCSLPGSSVHGVLQARILEWEAIRFSREG